MSADLRVLVVGAGNVYALAEGGVLLTAPIYDNGTAPVELDDDDWGLVEVDDAETLAARRILKGEAP
jgi:hypothetical protein